MRVAPLLVLSISGCTSALSCQKQIQCCTENSFGCCDSVLPLTCLVAQCDYGSPPKIGVRMFRRCSFVILTCLALCVTRCFAEPASKLTVYNFSLVDLNSKVVPLSSFKGKVLLVVNLASLSAYHDQIESLNELQKTYQSQGLVVLGIPSSDFGGEEQKDISAIRHYYMDVLGISFPVFAPSILRGVHAIPLYNYLCDPKESVPGGDIHWNFTKFLIDRQGHPLARYEVSDDPGDVDFKVLIESALDGKLKKQAAQEKEQAQADSDEDAQ